MRGELGPLRSTVFDQGVEATRIEIDERIAEFRQITATRGLTFLLTFLRFYLCK